jgi:hypothetical protein
LTSTQVPPGCSAFAAGLACNNPWPPADYRDVGSTQLRIRG